MLNGDILLFLNGDIRSLLTLFNSVDFQSCAHLFRSGILSIEGDWGEGAIVGIPIEGDVLATSLNLERKFFINADSVVSALSVLGLSDINKTSQLIAHAIRSTPWPLVEEVSVDTVQRLAHLLLAQVNSNFINFIIEADNTNVSLHYFVTNQFRTMVHLYIENNSHDQILELVEVFAFILGQMGDLL